MDRKIFFHEIVEPSLTVLASLTGIKVDDAARVEGMTIAGQESNWDYRRQIGGPARSFWQFERGGGVAGLFSVTPTQLQKVCDFLSIPFDSATVFEAMAWNDMLACCMARLLLWTDPQPLPKVGDVEGGWDYYLRNWRPGAPHHDSWATRYNTALSVIQG